MKKPDTTRQPLAVIEWVVTELRGRGVDIDAYHDLVSNAVLVIDYTQDPPLKMAKPRAGGNSIAADLLKRHAPDLTMPKKYVGNHKGRIVPAPAPAPPPPPLTQAELRARAQTPLERAMVNGLGRDAGAAKK